MRDDVSSTLEEINRIEAELRERPLSSFSGGWLMRDIRPSAS